MIRSSVLRVTRNFDHICFVRTVESAEIEIEFLGIRHSSIHDTTYVESKIENEDISVACVEKNPSQDLCEYKLQTRKIIGLLEDQNVDIWEFDILLDENPDIPEFNDTKFDSLDNSDDRKSKKINRMRRKVRNQKPATYQEIFIKRESAMKGVLQRLVDDIYPVKAKVIVGESHVPPLYRFCYSIV